MRGLPMPTDLRVGFCLGALLGCLSCSSRVSVGEDVPPPAPAKQDTREAAPAADGSRTDAASPHADTIKVPLDVVGSPECDAYCDKRLACGYPCRDLGKYDCFVEPGKCPAAVKAFLQCQADEGIFDCTPTGFTAISGCKYKYWLCDG